LFHPFSDPVDALSDMRRADAVCAKNGRPAGVTESFQVCENSIDPTELNRCRNLLTNDDWRTALFDETVEDGPEVPLVFRASFLSGRGEGLAGEACRPDRFVVGPAGEAEGERPSRQTCEKMMLREPLEVFRSDFREAPRVDFAIRYLSCRDQILDPLSGVRVEFVVVVHVAAPVKLKSPCSQALPGVTPKARTGTRRLRTLFVFGVTRSIVDCEDATVKFCFWELAIL
jgi:hypothetical protein